MANLAETGSAETGTAAAVAASPRRAAGVGDAARLMAGDIKLAHSIFALPFAVLGAFLAGLPDGKPQGNLGLFVGKLAVIVVCMVAARTWAMLVNRLADRAIDERNERTSRRVFASGAVSPILGYIAAGLAAAVFVGATALFWWLFDNRWPLYLSGPVLIWIAFYSFTKRFTALCHVFLGGALAVSPLAAAIAMNPQALAAMPSIGWLAGFVLLWVAGFDVIYALQDVDFDRANNLRSIPAALGNEGARWASRGLHAGALLTLLAAWTSEPRFGAIFGVGVGLVAALLVVEHALVTRSAREDHKGPALHMAFFTVNGVVSCILGVLGCVDVLR